MTEKGKTIYDHRMGTMTKAYVLLSGGIDSGLCLWKALHAHNQVVGVSFNYGQRHMREISAAAALCRNGGARHLTIDIPGIMQPSMLTDVTKMVPDVSYADIKGVSPMFVPNRNMIMLANLLGRVQADWNEECGVDGDEIHDPQEWTVYFGAHAEDAQNWAYPDCTPEFTGAMAAAFYAVSQGYIRLAVPLQHMMKDDIIREGSRLHFPFELSWSCYKGEELHCGTCATCRSRRAGFLKAQVFDPTRYAAEAA
jgi:7-cyano-7-deazaguanine synthase